MGQRLGLRRAKTSPQCEARSVSFTGQRSVWWRWINTRDLLNQGRQASRDHEVIHARGSLSRASCRHWDHNLAADHIQSIRLLQLCSLHVPFISPWRSPTLPPQWQPRAATDSALPNQCPSICWCKGRLLAALRCCPESGEACICAAHSFSWNALRPRLHERPAKCVSCKAREYPSTEYLCRINSGKKKNCSCMTQ